MHEEKGVAQNIFYAATLLTRPSFTDSFKRRAVESCGWKRCVSFVWKKSSHKSGALSCSVKQNILTEDVLRQSGLVLRCSVLYN